MMRTSASGDKTPIILEDAMKIVEDLTRIH